MRPISWRFVVAFATAGRFRILDVSLALRAHGLLKLVYRP